MRKALKNANFKELTKTGQYQLWIVPITGRTLLIGDYCDAASAVIRNGGIFVEKSAEIVDIIHQLNSDEHCLIEKML